jgi:glycosyltransferase involved in cell wall biosynthesis
MGLFDANEPAAFWQVLSQPQPPAEVWRRAIDQAAHLLPDGVMRPPATVEALLDATLGEGQFGPAHWQLSVPKRLYYDFKPILPSRLTHGLRRVHRGWAGRASPLRWPIEDRYVRFLWSTIRTVMRSSEASEIPFIDVWPHGYRYAFVLTHDVETMAGQRRVRELADLDASYGFRSSFNFVPERYPLDRDLIEELKGRGFEVGVHGLNHDGKLFRSSRAFLRKAARINTHLRQLQAVGFRAPLTHRNPQWMQALDIEYDLSFFDTDPFEPIAGGTMSIWPFAMGRFIELPYTLAQDSTLVHILGETEPTIWLKKLEFLREYRGLALLNSHPDYLSPVVLRLYAAFLEKMAAEGDRWHALPHEVASWWRARMAARTLADLPGSSQATMTIDGVVSVQQREDAPASTVLSEGEHPIRLLQPAPPIETPAEQAPGRSHLRVLMVSQHTYPHPAHPTSLYPEHPTLRRNVAELLKSGCEVDLVCVMPRLSLGDPVQKGLRVYGFPIKHRRSHRLGYPVQYALFFVWALLNVSLLSLRRRYDVTQVDTLPDFLVFSAVLPRIRGIPVVLYVYDLMPEMTVSRLRVGSTALPVRLATWLERASTAWADRVITVTDLFRRRLISRGLDPTKVSLVANSHPIGEIAYEPPADPPVLVIQTTLIERYGVQVAIEALARLRDRWPQLTLEVLGAGEYLPALLAQVRKLGLEGRVRITGYFLPWHDAMARVRRATLGIVPIIADGYGDMILPNKVFEFASMGVPMVCSRLRGIEEHFTPDTVAYFEPGVAVDLAAQVDRLLSDPDAARIQAARAKRAMSDLAWDRCAHQYIRTLSGT